MTSSASTGGLCEHHTEHDEACGYTEGTPETPCSHEHTDECYETVTECVHEHDGDCYEKELVCEKEDGEHEHDEDCYEEKLSCDHECSEESGCITETLNCTHEHDEACGYQPAVEGTPCGYVCEFCGSEDPEQKDEQEDEQKDGQKTFTVAQVEAMIDALHDVEYVEALDPKEDAETLEEIYLQAAEAADAFDTLSDEDREKVSNLDKLMELHEWFDGGVATMDESVFRSGTFNNSNGDTFSWTLYSDGKLTITKTGSGTGAMPYWPSGNAPWNSYSMYIKAVVIGDGVTSIGNNAFYNCMNLKSVELPAGLETIGSNAFDNCNTALESITIPASVTEIGGGAFQWCAVLKTVTFAENSRLNILGASAFQFCSALESITIPAGVTTIGAATFEKCTALKSITIPAGVKTIGGAAFQYCSALESITIPASVTEIGGSAFNGCTGLTTVTFAGTNPPTINSSAFSDCNNPTISVPAGHAESYSEKLNGTGAKINPHTVTVQAGDGGSASASSGTSFGVGETVRLTYTPDSGYILSGWEVVAGNVTVGSDNTFTMPEADVTVKALFTKKPESSGSGSSGSSSSKSSSSGGSVATTATNDASGTTSDSTATASSSPFTDVSEADWYYPDVAFVYACGLLGGTGDGSFAPYASVSRLSLAELFYRMEGCPAVTGRNNFTDVTYDPDAANDPDAAGAYDAVTWARQSGVLTGFGDGTFRPDSPITREQFAAAFYNYAKYKGYDVSDTGVLDTYADGAAVSAWSLDAVNWAVGAGIINSRTDELFAPQAETMNAELAVMLHRFIEKYGLVPVPSPTGDGTVSWIKLPDAA